jgi:hypothetical protein
MIAISRTLPFRRLQSRIGSATYRLNTILVGLALVADGGSKRPNLAVTWRKPENPEIAQQVANQAEIFACSAAMVFAVDVFDQFLRDIAKQAWLGFKQETQDIAAKAKPRAKADGGDYSVAERTVALLEDLNLPIGPAVGAIELLSKWRNITVHSLERKYDLNQEMRKLLENGEQHFRKHYSNLDIALAIQNFERRNTPVPKETTSLIAAAQNLSRSIDEAAIRRVAGTSQGVQEASEKLLKGYFTNPERQASAWSEVSEAWQGSPQRRRKNFTKVMQRVGLTETNSPISAGLPQSYIEEIIALTVHDLADRFDIQKGHKS